MRQCFRSDGNVGAVSTVRRSRFPAFRISDVSGRDLLPLVVASELDDLAEGFAVGEAV